MEGDGNGPLLADSDQEIPGHPEMISHVDTGARADLELPLTRHDFCVDTGDGDTGVETGSVMRLDHVSSVDRSSSCRSPIQIFFLR